MRNVLKTKSPCCVIIPVKRTALEITTTPAHALSIIDGKTDLPAKGSKVVDADGRLLSKQDLSKLIKEDNEPQ